MPEKQGFFRVCPRGFPRIPRISLEFTHFLTVNVHFIPINKDDVRFYKWNGHFSPAKRNSER
jgi:hypothetical protein